MPEKEYIERERATEFIDKCLEHEEELQSVERETLIAIKKRLETISAADVRPVVFCRDCKYAPIGDKDGDDLEWPHNEYDGNPCPHKCSDNWYSHKPAPDFFCAAGEKREER